MAAASFTSFCGSVSAASLISSYDDVIRLPLPAPDRNALVVTLCLRWDAFAQRAFADKHALVRQPRLRGDERSAATRIIDRKPVKISTSELPIIASPYQALRWQNANGGDLFLSFAWPLRVT
jgi:hypothetical protein